MKIAVVQIESVRGDIDRNITRHAAMVQRAAARGAQLVVFPELSLTGYDAPGAEQFATSPHEKRFLSLQSLADEHRVSIAAGLPLRAAGGATISMLIFQPDKPLETYAKRFLHADEVPYFVPGTDANPFCSLSDAVTFAICYELSVPEHAQQAYDLGASVYVASVAKTHTGVAKAAARLADISREFGMTVLLSNCVGPCDGSPGGGGSAVWAPGGVLLAEMNADDQGFIIYDPSVAQRKPDVVVLSVDSEF